MTKIRGAGHAGRDGRRDHDGQRARSLPTPILISRRTKGIILAAVVIAALLLVWQAPNVVTLSIGGLALAMVLSFPVGILSRFMPRGVSILLAFLLVMSLLLAIVAGVVPLLVQQLASLATAAPGIAHKLGGYLTPLAARLGALGLLPVAPAQFLENLRTDLLRAVQHVAGSLLGQLGGFVTGAVETVVMLVGMVVIAAYLLSDARMIQAAVLRAAPHGYRRDVLDLWNEFRFTLSRYLGGLALSLGIQGVLSGIAMAFLGVPYAALLGAVVGICALIPYVGAWISAIPSVLMALSVSPTTALLTGILFLLIHFLDGHVLTPRIQAQVLHLHPVIVLLAAVAAGELAGLAGVVLAVPTLAVLRVIVDFFRARLRTVDTRVARLARAEATTLTLP